MPEQTNVLPEQPVRVSPLADLKFSHIAILIVVGIFATTLPQPQVLGRLPLIEILKNELKVDRTSLSSFFFLCGLAWYFKPFAGILTDAFPLFKTRRRHYLIISASLAAISWASLAFLPHRYEPLLLGCIVVNAFMVIASTVAGAILVEAGQAQKSTGRLSSLRIFTQNFAGVINGPASGFLTGGTFVAFAKGFGTSAFSWTSFICAFIIFALVPVSFFWLRERPVATGNRGAIASAGTQLGVIFSSKLLWLGILLLGLFYFAPGFATPLLYKQQNEFNLSLQTIGNLGSVGAVAALFSAAGYAVLCRKLSLRNLIITGVIANAAGNFFYLLYSPNVGRDALIEAQNGLFFTIAELSMLDLAARATPAGCEGLGYSLMLSIRNVALFGADILGSKLADSHVAFWKLVVINSATTLLVLPLLLVLPPQFANAKDRSGKLVGAEEAA